MLIRVVAADAVPGLHPPREFAQEDPGAETVDRGTQTEVAIHFQRGEADIHSVEEGDDIEDK